MTLPALRGTDTRMASRPAVVPLLALVACAAFASCGESGSSPAAADDAAVGPSSSPSPSPSAPGPAPSSDDAAVPPPDTAPVPDAAPPPPERKTRFALLGDFGVDNAAEAAVADLVKAWGPDFIVTLGDNNYPDGSAATIDAAIGKYYSDYIFPYRGAFGRGATEQRFFACLGNHDWDTGSPRPHQDYFDLPGNERYWELAKGPVRFFCLDSDPREPDGTTSTSIQGKWLEQRLRPATDAFRLVVFHHPSHSSGQHGSQAYMQWPFQAWGASAVYTGHDHNYERFDFGPGTIPYVVQGLGGANLRPMATSRAGQAIAYAEKHGVSFVEADERYADFTAVTVGRDRVDEHVLVSDRESRRPTDTLFAAGGSHRFFEQQPPAGWNAPGFDTSGWKVGAAPLGYGQGGERTVLARGLAHYFVTKITVPDPRVYDHAVAWIQRDDGVALYVNGWEIARSNLPEGALTAQTLAPQTVGFAAERAWVPIVVPTAALRAGENIIAVELHQASATSSDATFDIRFEGKR